MTKLSGKVSKQIVYWLHCIIDIAGINTVNESPSDLNTQAYKWKKSDNVSKNRPKSQNANGIMHQYKMYKKCPNFAKTLIFITPDEANYVIQMHKSRISRWYVEYSYKMETGLRGPL